MASLHINMLSTFLVCITVECVAGGLVGNAPIIDAYKRDQLNHPPPKFKRTKFDTEDPDADSEPDLPSEESLGINSRGYASQGFMKFPKLDKYGGGERNLSRSSKPTEVNPRSGSAVYEEEENREQYLNRKYPDEIVAGFEEKDEELRRDDSYRLAPGHPCGGLCKKGEYMCPNSCSCIPNLWRCDMDADCEENEDEMGCEDVECNEAAGHVRCPRTGRCILKRWLCDGDDDCGDFSDETHCSGKKVNCTYDEFECGNGLCIPRSWVCDGENDCRDYSDEFNCTKKLECSPTEFRCSDGTCISSAFKCDNAPDCQDGSDEAECYADQLRCTPNEFKCEGYPRCVQHIFRCDGDDDCGDGSDEENCPAAVHAVCLLSEFRCNSGKCILKKFVCDGEKDCEQGEDEGGCLKEFHKTCTPNEFTCSAGNCISSLWVCDGVKDCAMGGDEEDCKTKCSAETQFACNPINSTPPIVPGTKLKLLPTHTLRVHKACISKNRVCDGKKDCPRGEDERNCPAQTECRKNKTKCHNFCTILPDGSEGCGCSHGYVLSSDGFSCHDINECAEENEPICSQICANTRGSFKCSCKNGYVLRPDGRTCKAIGAPPALIFANRIDLRQVTIDNLRYSAVLKGLNNAIALDYHYAKSYVFWSDLSFDVISRAFLNGTKVKDIVRWGLQNTAGIAVDWVHDLLFWTDSSTRRLEVSDLDGTKRHILVSSDLDKPRAIVVHPEKGLIFWSDLGPHPRIESIQMDGENRKIIVNSSLHWPNGLTIDYPTDRLYWADARTHLIENCNFDGSNRRQIVTKGLPHPFSLTIFDDALYWTDWHTKSISTSHKLTGSGFKIIHSGLHFPMGIKSYHPQSQPFYKNHCGERNGGCSYLCLPNTKSYSCVCPLGSELGEDRRTCKPPSKELLLVARKKDLRLSLVKNESSVMEDAIVPLDGIKSAEAIAWDSSSDSIFWSDIETKSISMASLNGSNQKTIFRYNLDFITGLDFDWITKKLYWIDSGNQLIETAAINGSRTVLIWDSLDKPKDIVVAPMQGLIFWTDGGKKPKIESAFMDGSNRKVLVKENLKSPLGLTIDFEENRLYWVDSGTHSLESVSFSGDERKAIIEKGLPSPYSLVIFGPSVIWTDLNTSSIHAASKENGKNHRILRSSLSNLMDIKVFHRERKEVYSKCSDNNGGCSHLCLLAGSLQKHSCACPTGLRLSSDNKTCIIPSKYLLMAHRTHIRKISFDVPYTIDVVLPLPPLRSAVSVDVDTKTGDIFWSDNAMALISKASSDFHAVSRVILSGIGNPDSLAIDSANQKLYWTDAYLEIIQVCDFNGSNRSILVWENVDSPRAINLHIKQSWMFWTDWGNDPKIERADMNGEKRQTLQSSNLKWPNGLTIDFEDSRLFWSDAWHNQIECSDLDGKNRRSFLSNVEHPYGLAIVDSFLYLTDWKTETLQRVDKRTGKYPQVISKHLKGLMGIKFIEMGKVEANSCGSNNGGCSHLCLRSSANFTCKCPTGLLIKPDGKTCLSHPSAFVMISAKQALYRLSLDVHKLWPVNLPVTRDVHNAVALDFHWNASAVYYADVTTKVIRKMGIDGASNHTDVVTNILSVNGIAVEWLANNIYWTDGDAKSIHVARLDGSFRKTLAKSNLEDPWSIAVFPQKGYLYWTDWGDHAKIEQSLLDGSERKIIVSNDLMFPKSLTIDYSAKRLYWVDSVKKRIETSDLHGQSRVVLIQKSVEGPFSLTQLGNNLFWTDIFNKSLHVADKLTGAHKEAVKGGIMSIMEIKAMSSALQTGWSPCVVDNGGCSHLCFYKGYRNSYTCGCPDLPDITCREDPSKRVEDRKPMDESDKPESEIAVFDDNKKPESSHFPPLSVVVVCILSLTAIVIIVFLYTLTSVCDRICCRRKRMFTFMNPNYTSNSSNSDGSSLSDRKPMIWRKVRYEKSQDRVYEEEDGIERCTLRVNRSRGNRHREVIELPTTAFRAPPRPPKPAYLST